MRKPELQLLEQTAALGSGQCRVTLNCSASGGGDVTYTWYRGGERIPTPRSPFRLEEQVDVNGGHIYTCNVSNPVSWAHQSLQLGQGCGSAPQSECSAWGGTGRRVLGHRQAQEQETGGHPWAWSPSPGSWPLGTQVLGSQAGVRLGGILSPSEPPGRQHLPSIGNASLSGE